MTIHREKLWLKVCDVRSFQKSYSRLLARQRAIRLAPQIAQSARTSPDGSRPYESELTSDLAKTKKVYKDGIVIVKDILDVGWKLAPLAFFPASLCLWIYLGTIHWTIIFQDSAMTGSGLIFLFSAAMLLAFAVVFQFIVPSLLLITTVSYYGNEKIVPKAVRCLYLQTVGGWLLGCVVMQVIAPHWGWLIFAMPFVVASRYGLTHKKDLELEVNSEARKYASTFRAVILAGGASVTTLSISFPLLLTTPVVRQYAAGTISEWMIWIAVCIATSAISMVPGFMYLNARVIPPANKGVQK